MTKDEALEMLKNAPSGDVLSKINTGLTQRQCLDIVRSAVENYAKIELTDILEKRVYQVCRNQRRPRY